MTILSIVEVVKVDEGDYLVHRLSDQWLRIVMVYVLVRSNCQNNKFIYFFWGIIIDLIFGIGIPSEGCGFCNPNSPKISRISVVDS